VDCDGIRRNGRGEARWDVFRLINPVSHAGTPEGIARYRVEPYVIAADVYAVAPHTGRGGWTWYLFICRHSDGTSLIKVFDFGIAKLMSDARVKARPRRPVPGLPPGRGFGLLPIGRLDPASFVESEAGQFLGTPDYMSSEQMRGADGVDQRSDVYSVGGILFEMLSGETPHPGRSCGEIIDHVVTQEPTRIETLRGTLPQSLAAIIHRALDADPEERFASALNLAVALAPFAEHRQARTKVIADESTEEWNGVTVNADSKIREKKTSLVPFSESTKMIGSASGELWSGFLVDLDRFRAALLERPSLEAALGAAHHVARAMESGLVQPAMIRVMTTEARQFFAQAEELVSAGSHEVTAQWARHEITTLHPEEALAMLDGALAHASEGAQRQALIALQEEAWFAASPK